MSKLSVTLTAEQTTTWHAGNAASESLRTSLIEQARELGRTEGEETVRLNVRAADGVQLIAQSYEV